MQAHSTKAALLSWLLQVKLLRKENTSVLIIYCVVDWFIKQHRLFLSFQKKAFVFFKSIS